jgi:hypothetical protein
MDLGAPLLRGERYHALIVAHCEIEVDRAHSLARRSRSRSPLFG